MKEAYFTAGNLISSSKEMLKDLYPEGQKRGKRFDYNQAAFLILDMQDYFLHPESHAYIPSAQAVLPGLNQLSALFQAHARPVLFSQHLNMESDAGSMKSWWRDLITDNHPYHALHSKLNVGEGMVFQKTQYDAFYRTDLEDRLKADEVKQVLVGGVMTHLCCETTARSAFMRGFDVFFLVDGTATYQRSFHLGTLRNLGHGFATLVTVPQIMDTFPEAGR